MYSKTGADRWVTGGRQGADRAGAGADNKCDNENTPWQYFRPDQHISATLGFSD